MRRAAIVLAVLAAACGGGEPEATDATPTPEVTLAPTATPEPLTTLAPGTPKPVRPTPRVTPSPTPLPPVGNCTDLRSGAQAYALLIADDNVYDPPCFVMKPSQGLRISNDGANLHNFSMEDALDIDIPSGDEQVTNPIGEALDVGDYPFFCKYHVNAGMKGTLKIRV